MINYNNIIWDFNGTILNDTDICLEILDNHMKERGLEPLSKERYREIFDFPLKEFYTRARFDFSTESYKDLADSFIKEYSEKRFNADIFPEIPGLISRIKREGGRNHILSAYRQNDLENMAGHLRIKEYFDTIAGLNDHYAHGKAEIAQEFIRRNRINRDKAVLIGDTTHDYEVSRVMGVHCILIASGHHSKLRLQNTGGSVLESHRDLESFLFS